VSSRRRTALVLLAALLGIAVAAAITYGTSQLVSQHIGLASEPITAGRALLAPAVRRAPATPTRTSAPPSGGTAAPGEPRTTSPAEAAPAPEAPAASHEAPAASPQAPAAPSTEHPRADGGAGGAGGDGHAQGDD
jgi:hypothetical protein